MAIIAAVVFGVCAFAGFYMAFVSYRAGDSPFLFAAFGMLFAIPFVVILIKAASKKSLLINKIFEKMAGKPETARFVPHWFLMTAIIIVLLVVLAAIAMGILRAVR